MIKAKIRQLIVLCGVLPAALGCSVAYDPSAEVEAIVAALSIRSGTRVADVGAGKGAFSADLARVVGADGFVIATEVDADDLDEIRDRLESVGLDNHSVLLGTDTATGLPDDCCDVILLRLVYHHFTEPELMRADLSRALVPGGLIAIIDIDPQKHWGTLSGVPDRGGHGILIDDLIEELAVDGFEVVERYPVWETDRQDTYGVVFRAPSKP